MINIEKKARVLTAEAKPYSFDGRSGTSYKARVLVDADIFPVKCTETDIKALEPYVGKDVDLVLGLTAPKEAIRLEFVAVKPKAN